MRQPTEHAVHVDSTCSRSQGRARNRYGLPRRAPTGQICTVAGDLLGEPRAAGALDASLAVEVHQVAYGDGFLEVALLFDEPALARAEGEGLVLQGTLAPAVAHRAVEGMVDQQELEDAVLGLLHLLGGGDHLHAVCRGHEAGGLEREAARSLDLHEAHAAHADRLHARVPAEARDVDASPLGSGDDHLAGTGLDRAAVDGDGQRFFRLVCLLAHRNGH